MGFKKQANILLVLLFLGACSQDDKMDALKRYVQQVKAKTSGVVEPLPEVKPYETFRYGAGALRSPFVPPMPIGVAAVPSNNGIHPDAKRRKEVLEHYPLDALRLVGTLERNSKRWAIILDTDGMVHRVSVGNYLGQHHGRISQIEGQKIEIQEIVTDGRGGWQKRDSSMTLMIE